MPRSTRSKKTNALDFLSIIVILVIAIFSAGVGYYVGLSMGANQMLQTVQQMVR